MDGRAVTTTDKLSSAGNGRGADSPTRRVDPVGDESAGPDPASSVGVDADAAPSEDLGLLRAYEPVLRLTDGELFLPAAVEDYVACCELLEHVAGESARVVAGQGELTLDRLADLGARVSGPGQFLRFVDAPFSWWEAAQWRRRSDRPKFRQANRLARVGLLSRIVDALMRMSLFFRGSVARGTQAAAEVKYRQRMRTDHHPYYGRVIRGAGYVALQYWMFYAFNDWRSRVYGVNDHEADWEQVIVYLAEQPDESLLPSWVVFCGVKSPTCSP